MLQGMFRSNFVLFGIPITTALFGDTAAGLAAILISVIIPLYNVLAVLSLEMFHGKQPSFLKMLKGIVTNPLIIASVIGIPVSYTHLDRSSVCVKRRNVPCNSASYGRHASLFQRWRFVRCLSVFGFRTCTERLHAEKRKRRHAAQTKTAAPVRL